MISKIYSSTEERMDKTIAAFQRELATLRAGRATPTLLDRIEVDYYGTMTPLNQLAGVSAPETRLLVIQPWDKGSIPEIEKAILKSDLGLTPSNDGQLIRLAIPQLTEERRKELVRFIRKKAEETKVGDAIFAGRPTTRLRNWKKRVHSRRIDGIAPKKRSGVNR